MRSPYRPETRDKLGPVWGQRSPERNDHRMDNRPETPKRDERSDFRRDQTKDLRREDDKPKAMQYQLRRLVT